MGSSVHTGVTILDYIDNIRVPGNVFQDAANEYWALVCLWDGMEFLYHQAQRCDQAVKQQVNPDGKVGFFALGNHPALNHVPKTLLTCAFHWYAISACQYVRTVGAIAAQGKYAERVIPEVLAFRNKVAAHFAWSTRDNRDNDAERLASILPTLTFMDESFYVAGFAVALRGGGKEFHSQAIKAWSLCRVHEALRKRYWPNQQTNWGSFGSPNAP